MISAEQAHQIADELVAQEHARSVVRRNATARRIPRVFQCAELQRLPAWHRRAVVDAAYKNVTRRPLLVGPAIAWVLGWGLVAWYLPMRDSLGPFVIASMLAIADIPIVVIYAVLIRREVRRRAGATAAVAANCGAAAVAPGPPESDPIHT